MANTPNKPRAVPTSKSKLASTSNNNTRAEAGPSRTSSNAQPNMKRKKAMGVLNDEQDDDDVHIVATKKARRPQAGRKKQEHQPEVVEDDDEVEFEDQETIEERGQEQGSDEVEEILLPVPKARKASSKKTAEVNGHATAPETVVTTKNKGKQRDKPGPLSKTKSSTRHTDVMDVDEVEGEGDDMNGREAELPVEADRTGKPGKSAKASREYTTLQKENERLKERLGQVSRQIVTL